MGSPAYKAGLKPGDVLIKIDDKSVVGKASGDIADMLKGPAGTAVHITVTREGTPDPIAFSVTRADIPKHDVDPPLIIRPGIGYIWIRSFQSEDTAEDFADDLQKLAGQNLTGLVIDLRDNGGGLLNSAIGISDDILDKNQLIVSQHGRVSPERRYYAIHGNQGVRVPSSCW